MLDINKNYEVDDCSEEDLVERVYEENSQISQSIASTYIQRNQSETSSIIQRVVDNQSENPSII